jgi:hypothetical protein
MIPTQVWRAFDAKHNGTGPIFVCVSSGDGEQIYAVGRLRPATATDSLDDDCCRIPTSDWIRMGAPMPGDLWATITAATDIQTVGTITLRPHREQSLMELDDPVVTLSAEISAGWACVMEGAELVLPCGTFDIVGLKNGRGASMKAGCILNTDVILELVPALDAVESPPAPRPTPTFGPSFSNAAATMPALPETPCSDPRFPGRGYRLGSS